MAKDPATLFYWNDWQGGTSTMTRFIKGCYMDILCAQFNQGPLSLDEIKTVLGSDFGQAWPILSKKFEATDGKYFNGRMETERNKRKVFSDNQKKKANKRWGKDGISPGICIGNAGALPIENENRNENVIKGERGPGKGEPRFSKPTVEDVKSYCTERGNTVDAVRFHDHYESNGWKIGGKAPMKDWKAAVRTWEKNSFSKNSPPPADTKKIPGMGEYQNVEGW